MKLSLTVKTATRYGKYFQGITSTLNIPITSILTMTVIHHFYGKHILYRHKQFYYS